MNLNFVPCLTWVAKGIAKSRPDQLQLSAEELKNLIDETSQEIGSNTVEEDLADEDVHNDNDDCSVKDEINEDEDKDFDTKYDLDTYDDDDDKPFMNIADVAVYVDNQDDNYITKHDAISDDEKDEEENFLIKDNDNLLVIGHVEDDSSVLEIYVYNKEEDSFYVHHDIVLPSYPLALEWLNFHPSDDTPGNYVAVGDMSPVIKIWDLDVVDILESDYCLGKKPKKKKKAIAEKPKVKRHTDAVLSLSWNKQVRNVLASGSADSSIILWDLQEGAAVKKLKYHTNKVQALQWHPTNKYLLLSGDTDGMVKLYDCEAGAEKQFWMVDGEIEKVTWNLHDSSKFFCSTDEGFVYCFDMTKDEMEHSVQAHMDGITGLDMCHEHPNILLTASMDKTLKLWNVENGFKLIKSQKLKVGSIYTAKFAPDSELIVAAGGNNSSNNLKVMDLTDRQEAPNAAYENSTAESQMTTNYVPAKKKAQKFTQSSWNNQPGTSHNTYSTVSDSDRSKSKKFKHGVKKKQ